MVLNFKVISRTEPGVSGGGTRKWYATVTNRKFVGIDEITTQIEKSCTVNGADVRAVLYALVDVVQTNLAKGEIVDLQGFGSLRINISSKGQAGQNEVDANTITGSRIIFNPSEKLKNMLKLLKFQKSE